MVGPIEAVGGTRPRKLRSMHVRAWAIRVVAVVIAVAGCVVPATSMPPTGVPPAPSAISPSPTSPFVPSPTTTLGPSPTSLPSPTSSLAPLPTPSPLAPGGIAYVSVAVATGWRSPDSTRPVDAPALANPARIREWLAALTPSDQSDLIGRADTQVLLGDPLLVTAVDGPWVRVAVAAQGTPLDERGYPVWLPADQVTTEPPHAAAETATVIEPTGWLLDERGAPALEVSFGTRLPVVDSVGDRTAVALPHGSRLWVANGAVAVTATGVPAATADASSIVRTARQFVGLRYLWAGTSGFGFDCSGLVYAVYRLHGIDLPRDSAPQSTVGRAVALEDLRPGDLVFFGAAGRVRHVAIFVGDGRILESPGIGKPVREVDLEPGAAVVVARRVLP